MGSRRVTLCNYWIIKESAFMDLLIQKFERIKEIDAEWSQTVKDAQNQNVPPENQELIKAFNELFSTVQEAYKKNIHETEKISKKYMGDDCQWLLEDVKKSLEFFFVFSELREIQNKNEDQAKKIIDYFYTNVIAYFDREFANAYVEFGFKTGESFFNTARALDALTEYYVSQHFAMGAIRKDIKEETEFSDNICDYLVDKICEYYHTLQLNVIMDMIQLSAEKK